MREALVRGATRGAAACVGAAGLSGASRAGLHARRSRRQGQVGHPDLDVGRPVAPRHLRSQAGAPGNDYCGPLNKPIADQRRRHPHRRAAAAAGQAGRQVLDHPQHDPRHQRPRDGRLHGADRPRARRPAGLPVASGAVVSLFKGYDAGYQGLIPPYIVLTEPQGRFSEAGFLGPRYKPFATGGDPGQARFAVEGVVAQGITDQRQQRPPRPAARSSTRSAASLQRRRLARRVRDSANEQAYDLILGDAGKVFDLSPGEATSCATATAATRSASPA